MLRRGTVTTATAGDLAAGVPARVPAWRRPIAALRDLSMTGRYLLLSLVFVIVGGGIVAYALGQVIETSAINRTTSITALYVESFVAPELQSLRTSPSLTQPEIDSLKRLLSDSALGQKIVSIRIWSPDGEILYSPLPELIGKRFDMSGDRAAAVAGAVTGDVSDLTDPENSYERQHWNRLIEIYLPVRATGSSQIIAVAEFYQLADELDAEVTNDRLIAWGLVAGATVLAYVALARVVRQGSATIGRQERELRQQVGQLSRLLDQNARLSDRIRQAAARTTALTELERRRIGADLHDGPSQSLAFAMLRLDTVESRLEAAGRSEDPDLVAVRHALDEALTDMRSIAAGLRSPELDAARPDEIVRRAVADHERRAGTVATVDVEGIPETAPLATKIALYRILSEALSNAARHGGGVGVNVRVTRDDEGLVVEVADSGPGFDATASPGAGHLGLAGMRERAELLGGRFELASGPGAGTRVRAYLPLAEAGAADR
jgi:signal transduction histidine kinase